MVGLIQGCAMFFADAGPATTSAFTRFYNDYFNIPGFELWKFVNLALFITIITYLVKKPLTESFKARRDKIREELILAEQAKQAALAKLTEAEGRLAQLATEKENILKRAAEEADFEKKRLAEQTKIEAERLKQQAAAELARLAGQSRAELRRFSAEESVRLAEEKLRANIDSNVDAVLVRASIDEIGGLN